MYDMFEKKNDCVCFLFFYSLIRLAKVLADVKVMTDTAARDTQDVLSFRAKCDAKQKVHISSNG